MTKKSVVDKLIDLEEEANEAAGLTTGVDAALRNIGRAITQLRVTTEQLAHTKPPLTAKKQLWKDREDAAAHKNAERHAAAKAEQDQREAEARKAGEDRYAAVVAKREARGAR